jgi:hypothetical protein
MHQPTPLGHRRAAIEHEFPYQDQTAWWLVSSTRCGRASRHRLRPPRQAASDSGGYYTGSVSQPLAEPPHLPPATEQQVRNRARELVSLAARHGITDLAFASPGRLRGHVADDRDLFDMFEFQRAATSLLSAEVALYSDGALNNDHVSPDLAAAAPL